VNEPELLVEAAIEDLRAQLVALGAPLREVLVVVAVELGEGDRAVQRDPAHDLAQHEVRRLAADLPDALVRLAPLAQRAVGERA